MINPKVKFCSKCGFQWIPKLHHKIVMLVFGRYVWVCPNCQTRITFILVNHVVKVDTKKVLDERIWRNG